VKPAHIARLQWISGEDGELAEAVRLGQVAEVTARRGGRVAGVEMGAGEGGRVHVRLVLRGYFDAPTIRTARNPLNRFFLFISFFFWAGSHKCELKTNGGKFWQRF
jgi:hypothetical protein